MPDLEEIVDRIGLLKRDIDSLVGRHESSPVRVFELQETIRNLKKLTLKQQTMLDEAVTCLQHETYRGAHVLSWAAMADYLETWLVSDKKKLADLYPDWNTETLEKLRESSNEFKIISALRKCDCIGKDEEQVLQGLLKRRNLCAHPTDYKPDLNMSVGYLSELKHWFETFEKRR